MKFFVFRLCFLFSFFICFPVFSGEVIKIAAEKTWPGILRGVNVDRGSLRDIDFAVLKSWNVNTIRISIGGNKQIGQTIFFSGASSQSTEFNIQSYSDSLENVEKLVSLAETYRIFVVLTVSDVIGRSNDIMFSLFDDASFYYQIIPLWSHLAKKYGNNPWVIGYDLLNEPNGKSSKIWTDTVSKLVIDEIRRVDSSTYIIYEPAPWALPDQGFAQLTPVAGKKIIYSFHFYYPHTYTHQGIKKYTHSDYLNKEYPGSLKLFPSSPSLYWGKNELERSMANVIKFQTSHNVKILVGEFGVVRWAPGAHIWLSDSIDIFEKYGWNWLFHSYGDRWNGWNPTFGPADPQSSDVDGGQKTRSLDVLIRNFSKNK